ncbi:hypothetical protein [Dyadobacter sp. 32]|uniref:hypothetical protein n=1 Tax=Dyadobacter sp. 32 TaxID=538966 RepID=UPI0011F028F2
MRFTSDDKADMRPVWLSQQEIKDPNLILDGFIKEFTVTDCRFLLWRILVASLSSENQDSIPTIPERIYFFENLMPFIEAIYLGAQKKGDTTDPNPIGESVVSSETSNRYDDLSHATEKERSGLKQNVNPAPSLQLKKCQKYLRKNSIWYRERIDDPHKAITAFFDSTSVETFKTELYGILRACSENHPYQKDSPADVLYFFEKLESMINAGYIIHKISRKSTLDTLDTTESVPLFYGQSANDTETSATSFIGVDSEEMIAILNEFFDYKSLKQWKEELYEICIFSLSNQAAQLWTVWIDSLAIYAHIIKLVECLKSSKSLSRLTKD